MTRTGLFLRLTTSHKSWIQTHISNMISVQNPAEESLNTQTVATVFASSKFPLIRVPKQRETNLLVKLHSSDQFM